MKLLPTPICFSHFGFYENRPVAGKARRDYKVSATKKTAIAADLVLVFHALFVLFAVFGGLLILVDFRFLFLHLPVVAWSSIVNLMHRTCPLTPLEQRLRLQSGQTSFEGGWLRNYIEPWLRPLGMPYRLELVAGVAIVVWNAILYGAIWVWLNSA
jgi:hypothetical protein